MKKTLVLLSTIALLCAALLSVGISAVGNTTVIEGESMTVISATGTHFKQSFGSNMIGGDKFSGKAQYFFKGTKAGDTIELSFSLTSDFSGMIGIAHCKAGDFGIYDIYVDDVLVYDELDMYAKVQYVGNEVIHSGDVSLGYLELDAGTHTLTLICTGKNSASSGYVAGIDYIKLSAGYEYYDYDTTVTFEGEDMKVEPVAIAPKWEQQAGSRFSGGSQKLFKNIIDNNEKASDAIVALSFNVSEAYTGEGSIYLCNAPDFGIYDIYIDDKLLISEYNGYVSGGVSVDKESLGQITLSQGEHIIKFVGKGVSSGNTTVNRCLGVDCIELGTTKIEDTAMTVLPISMPKYWRQPMGQFGAGFSESYMIRYNSGSDYSHSGEFMLSFNTDKAFDGNAYLYFCKAADFGIYDIYLDDKLVRSGEDFYSASLKRTELCVEDVELLPGKHTLKFVGKGTNGSNSLLGIDCLVLGEEPDYDYRYADVVNLMTDFKSLALLPSEDEIGAAATSYDRVSKYDAATDSYVNWGDRVPGATHGQGWTSNQDGYGYIEAIDGDPIKGVVALDVKGAGAVYRSFFATVGKGHIKVYVDGELTIDMPLEDYVKADGRYDGLDNLVYETSARGYNNYVPITFNESCKIVLCGGREKVDTDEGFWGRYFTFNYRLFDGTVEPIRVDFTAKQMAVLTEANSILGDCGESDESATVSATEDVTAGTDVTMLTLSGTKAITSLKVSFNDKLTETERLTAMQKLELSIYWDGETTPSVWAPLGDFFGTSMGGQYQSYPMGMSDYSTFYSNWYMPFENGAEIVIENLSEYDYDLTVEVVTEAIDGNIDDYGRFHAKWSMNRFADEKRPYDYPVLTTKGSGRFLGFNLHIYNIVDIYWWGEGDEKFFVDGEKFPSTHGTGSEDYFGYAWCSANYFSEAYHSQNVTPRVQGLKGNYNNVRFHFGDSIPFTESFVAAMEKFHGDDFTQYAATAYWYLDANGEDPYTPVKYTGEEADSRYMSLRYEVDKFETPATTNVIEAENMAVVDFDDGSGSIGSGYLVQDMDALFPGSGFNNGKQVFSGAGVKNGSEITLRFTLKEDFDGMLRGAFCMARDYGKIRLYIDGTELGESIDCYLASGVKNTGLLDLGSIKLDKGAHDLTVKVVGKNDAAVGYAYGIDCLVFGEHLLTYNEAVAPKCVSDVYIAHWSCEDCDDLFYDIYGTRKIDKAAVASVDVSNHFGESEVSGAVAATYSKDGYTGDLYCLSCNGLIAKGEVIDSEMSDKDNIMKVYKEALVVNGEFDGTPVINVGDGRYYTKEPGAWYYVVKDGNGIGTPQYGKDDDDGYLRIEANNSLVTLGYVVGLVQPDTYTLTFDIYPETNVGGYRNRIYYLDSDLPATNGNAKMTVEHRVLESGKWNTVSVTFTVEEETFIAFDVYRMNESLGLGDVSFRIDNVSILGTEERIIGLTSNGRLTATETVNERYFTASDANGDISINYSNGETLRPGIYKLSGLFFTEADGVTLEASIGMLPAGSAELEKGEWNEFEVTVAVKKEINLSDSCGISFVTDSTAPLSVKKLRLEYESELPKPAVSQGITMILLKKLKGEYPGFVSNKPVELVVNGSFDEEPAIKHGDRRYYNQKPGTWSYAANSGTYAAEYITEDNNSYARIKAENATVAVAYAAGILQPNTYTLTMDVYPEYDIGGIRLRMYYLDSDVIATMGTAKPVNVFTDLKVSEWNTVSVTFTVDNETFVAFDFYGIKENPSPANGSFRFDNVSIIGKD